MSEQRLPGGGLNQDEQIACLVLPAQSGCQGVRRFLVARGFIEVGRSSFGGQPEKVRQVRQFISELLGQDWPHLDEVLLLASEIASNAVRHTNSGGSGQFEVMVAVCPLTRRVRVEVRDQGGLTVPRPGRAGPSPGLVTGGRGLGIVEVLADQWGHEGDQQGRMVWFELATKAET